MNRYQIRKRLSRCLLFTLTAVTLCGTALAGNRPPLPEPAQDEDFYANGSPDAAKAALGAELFFDKILSGNLNIACATCHHPFAGTGDGLSLPVGEGANGTGAAGRVVRCEGSRPAARMHGASRTEPTPG